MTQRWDGACEELLSAASLHIVIMACAGSCMFSLQWTSYTLLAHMPAFTVPRKHLRQFTQNSLPQRNFPPIPPHVLLTHCTSPESHCPCGSINKTRQLLCNIHACSLQALNPSRHGMKAEPARCAVSGTHQHRPCSSPRDPCQPASSLLYSETCAARQLSPHSLASQLCRISWCDVSS